MAIGDYSVTPASNTSISGINITEGCNPSGINDAIRQLMADLAADAVNKNGVNNLTAAFNEAKGANIASAGTTDIGAATGNFVDVTGTTTITALGTVQAGTHRWVRFTGALTLTHNATSLILPGATNITTETGDIAQFLSLGSGNWVCSGYLKANVIQYAQLNSPAFTGTPTVPTAAAGTNTTQAASCAFVQDAIDKLASDFAAKAIGEVFALWDHLTGVPVPSNSGAKKFIKLTAGLTGAAQYNAGLLSSETLSGTFPTNTALATIMTGPLMGQQIHLINTEGGFLRAADVSGVWQQDALQNVTASVHADGAYVNTPSGAFGVGSSNSTTIGGTGATDQIVLDFDASRVARTSDHTRPKNISATFYMRIV